MSAVPEGWKAPRRDWIARHKGLERVAAYRVEPGPLAFVIDLLDEAGGVNAVATPSGIAYRGLTWADIWAWVQAGGREDVHVCWRHEIVRLSSHLAGAMNTASQAESPAPYQPD